MNKFLLGISLLASVALTGCSADQTEIPATTGFGYVALECGVATDVTTRADLSQLCEIPTSADFTLEIACTDAGTEYTPTTFDPFTSFVSEDNRMATGNYTASVVCGDATLEGAAGEGCPCFQGEVDFEIEAQKVTRKEIEAVMTHAIITVDYTEQFLTYFCGTTAAPVVTLTTAAGNSFTFDSTATTTTPIFIQPGDFTLSGVAYKQTEEKFEFAAPAAECNVAANTLYAFTFDMTTAGSASVTISLNEQIVETITVVNQELNPES